MDALIGTNYHVEKIDGREIQKPLLPKILHSRAQAHIMAALSAVVPGEYEVLSGIKCHLRAGSVDPGRGGRTPFRNLY